MTTAIEARKSIQSILSVTQDGQIGPQTLTALGYLTSAADGSEWPPTAALVDAAIHSVLASTFADPEDLAAFKAAKARGESDQEAFKVGDNCVGEWGDSTAEGSGPSFALPPEDWRPFGAAPRLKKATISCGGKSVVAELKDSMPHVANITNGCRLDMNPDLCAALGIHVNSKTQVTWQWV